MSNRCLPAVLKFDAHPKCLVVNRALPTHQVRFTYVTVKLKRRVVYEQSEDNYVGSAGLVTL
jgi:hypothetical protein